MTVETSLRPLEAVLLRAGASDQDREAWLAQRRLGITGTEIRDLMLGTVRAADLIAQKLGRKSNDFAGNAYTAWGNEREPIIAAEILSRFGIHPETRLIRAADNERFLVSPDGLGEDFAGEGLGSEIKTAGKDIGTESAAYAEKGYEYQVTWGMRVTGFRRWLYAWEYRLGNPGSFEPGLLSFEWIEYDQALAGRMEMVARDFLAQLDAAAAADYVELAIDDELDTHAVNYLRFLGDEKTVTEAKKAEWAAMLARLEGCDAIRQEGATARVTYNPGEDTERDVPDVEAAKAADPLLFAEAMSVAKRWNDHLKNFTRIEVVPGKPSLTVTAIKPKGLKK